MPIWGFCAPSISHRFMHRQKLHVSTSLSPCVFLHELRHTTHVCQYSFLVHNIVCVGAAINFRVAIDNSTMKSRFF
jgi:hypothetical protein